MTPQNQPAPQIPETPEKGGVPGAPEKQTLPVTPEAAPQPMSPEKPATEKFSDQASQAPVQNVPQEPAVAEPTSAPSANLPVSEEEEANAGVQEMDKGWVKAVDTVIEADKDKPYEEEEDSEKLQVDYLSKRFGKKIDKE